MKFGKRDDSEPGGAVGDSSAIPPVPAPPTAADPPLPPVPESSPPVAEHEVPAAPVAEQETPGSPAGEELPIAHVEPVVEGEAYEVFADEPPETLNVQQHQPVPPSPPAPVAPVAPVAPAAAPMPFPVAEQPISVVTPGPGPAPVTTLGDAGEAFASGHAAAPGPSWQEPIMQIANERPELVVAAAFAGGLLAAMILRRLGN
jgi:hypothetical protein